MRRQLGAALLCAALLTGTAGAIVDPPENTYVADYAGVLDSDTEEYIIQRNETLNQATGAAIEVVTVDFLDGMEIDDYAYELFNTWGIGDDEADNGLLLLLAIGEENYYALQGSGIADALSASTLDDYLWNYLETDFAAGDYDAGVRSVFDAFYDWYDSYYGLSSSSAVTRPGTGPDYVYRPEPEPDYIYTYVGPTFGAGALLLLLVVLIVVVACLADGMRYRRYRRRYMMPAPGAPAAYGRRAQARRLWRRTQPGRRRRTAYGRLLWRCRPPERGLRRRFPRGLRRRPLPGRRRRAAPLTLPAPRPCNEASNVV